MRYELGEPLSIVLPFLKNFVVLQRCADAAWSSCIVASRLAARPWAFGRLGGDHFVGDLGEDLGLLALFGDLVDAVIAKKA